tara:strand:+ start:212 stop:475 length:264 start_codon:yes stop_codon:yes gene_type:complete
MNQTLEEAAERLFKEFQIENPIVTNKDIRPFKLGFINGAKWQKNDCVQFINKLEDESFDGWSEEAISGYLTACMTIKQKYIDMLNGN